MAGIDLHSNNLVTGIMDLDGKRLGHRKLDCELKKGLAFLAPYQERRALAQSRILLGEKAAFTSCTQRLERVLGK